jgi:hypothetical protein
MASPINSDYKNQINIISLGESFNASLYTDRKVAASSAAPSGASPHDIINRTATTPDLADGSVVYSIPGSGSFNPEVGQ